MAQSVRLEPCLELTQEQIGAFLGHLTDKGCRESSVQKYRRDLTLFYTMLPEDKQIRRGTVSAWRSELVERGYAPRTINAHVAEVNGLLDFLGHRECQLPGQLAVGPEEPPELSRSEYLRLLSAARVLKRERTYLLVKLFALTGVGVQDVSLLTAEDVEAGAVPGSDVRMPAFLRGELLDYCRRNGVEHGPVFVTRNGRPMYRTAVFDAIQRLSRDACVPEEKCNPRCLRKLWQTTQADLAENVRWLVEQTHERLLEQEQRAIGWGEAERQTL